MFCKLSLFGTFGICSTQCIIIYMVCALYVLFPCQRYTFEYLKNTSYIYRKNIYDKLYEKPDTKKQEIGISIIVWSPEQPWKLYSTIILTNCKLPKLYNPSSKYNGYDTPIYWHWNYDGNHNKGYLCVQLDYYISFPSCNYYFNALFNGVRTQWQSW